MAENLFLSCLFFFFLSVALGFLLSYKHFLIEKEYVSEREIILFDEVIYKKVSEIWEDYEKDISQMKPGKELDLFQQRIFPVIPEEELNGALKEPGEKEEEEENN